MRARAGDLARDEGLAAARRFVVEKDAVTGVETVGFAVVNRNPVRIELGHAIGTARIEGRGFLLRDFLHEAVEFGGGSLIETGLFPETEDTDRFEDAQRAQGVGIGSVFGFFEADGDVALGGEVINLVGLDFLNDADEVGGIRQVPVMQAETAVIDVRIFVDMIDAVGVEARRPAFDAVHLVTLVEQEFGEVGTILAGYTGD